MIKYLILGAFLLLMVIVGILSSRKVKTADDYVLGGRRMGPWLSAFSYGTTYFSAVVFVGYAGRFGWNFGLSSTWIGIGNAVLGSFLAWLVLAERTRRISHAMQSTTMAEFFRKRYDSPGLEKFSAVIIFVFLIPYSASVYQGLGYIMEVFFKGTFLQDTRISMLLMAVITGVYLYFGGYISTAVNSLIQGLIMIFGVIFMVWKVVATVGGMQSGLDGLNQIGDKVLAAGSFTSIGGPAPFDLVILILMTSVGTFGLPQMISKFNSIRDAKATRQANVMSTAFALIIGGGAYFMGGFSRYLNSVLNLKIDPAQLDKLMPRIFETILTPETMAVLVVLMLSASMSTLASVVLVSAPTFSKTILKNNKMPMLRLMSLVFVGISYLVALNSSAIVTLMAFSWGAVSGSFVGPYIWGLYLKKLTKAGAAVGMVCGLGTVVFGGLIVMATNASTAVWAPRLAVFAMVVSFILTPLVSLLTQKSSPIPEGAKFL